MRTISFRLVEGSALEFQTIVHSLPSPVRVAIRCSVLGESLLGSPVSNRPASCFFATILSGPRCSAFCLSALRCSASNRLAAFCSPRQLESHSVKSSSETFLTAGCSRWARGFRSMGKGSPVLGELSRLLFTNAEGFFMKSWIRLTTNRFKFSSSHLAR